MHDRPPLNRRDHIELRAPRTAAPREQWRSQTIPSGFRLGAIAAVVAVAIYGWWSALGQVALLSARPGPQVAAAAPIRPSTPTPITAPKTPTREATPTALEQIPAPSETDATDGGPTPTPPADFGETPIALPTFEAPPTFTAGAVLESAPPATFTAVATPTSVPLPTEPPAIPPTATRPATATPAPTPIAAAPTPAAQPSAAQSTIGMHLVMPGETLESIAAAAGVPPSTILIANQLQSDTALQQGRILYIPRTSGVVHVVATGETLNAIGRRYGVSVAAIASANALDDPGAIRVGQTLLIPGGSGPLASSP